MALSKTFGQVIQEARRIVMPDAPLTVRVVKPYTAGASTIWLDATSSQFNAVRNGVILGVDQEVFLVVGDPNVSTGVTPVSPGYMGSTEASHSQGALCEVKPRFTMFETGQFVIEELQAMASPSYGLGQICRVLATWIPTFVGYDLGGGTPAAFDSLNSRVLEVSYRIAPPIRTYPLIRRGAYRTTRNQSPTQSDFPSGNGIILAKPAYPGFPLTVQYTAPYGTPVNLGDDLQEVCGVPPTQQDIVYMGAVLRMAPDREIARNALDAQPDPRKATEVMANAMQSATNSLMMRYQRRCNQERSQLRQAYPQCEWY